ncbi:MAG: M20 family metallo-hydrolase [Planctomycetota bacterium]
MVDEGIADWLGESADRMVELQRELTARPALGPENGGEGEWEKARFLEGWLREQGLDDIRHYDCPDDRVSEGTRPNFVATLPGRGEAPPVWVLTHLDVVPPGEKSEDGSWRGWDSDPWQLRREGDTIYGRGVCDNQHSMVASIFAALALLQTEATPPGPVRLLLVADEETGSGRGLQYLLQEHRDLFGEDDLILVPDGGNADGTMIEVAEKSVLWLQFHLRGEQVHASRPDQGVNAFRAASHLVARLDEALPARFDAQDELFHPPRSTFEPTLHKANVPNVNTVPGEDVFCFDCRVLPEYPLGDVLSYVRNECRSIDARFDTQTEVSMRHSFQAAPGTDPDAPVVRRLESAVRAVYEVEPRTMGIGGQTVASFFRREGLPAVVWMTSTETEHQVNERCSVPELVGDARVFARVYANEG